jgi:hypothetical protein
MLSVPDRVCQLRINHVFNIYHGRASEYLCENFNINQGNIRETSNLNFITPNANLCSTNSFSYNAIKDWNSLPISIKNVNNKEAFKNAVKDFFILRQEEEKKINIFIFKNHSSKCFNYFCSGKLNIVLVIWCFILKYFMC